MEPVLNLEYLTYLASEYLRDRWIAVYKITCRHLK